MPPRMTDFIQHHHRGTPNDSRAMGKNKSDMSPTNVQLPPSPPLEHSYTDPTEETLPVIVTSIAPRPRPETSRRVSSPDSSLTMDDLGSQETARSPRNLSPARANTRSYSPSSASAPLMQRAHSSPGVDSTGRFITPANLAQHRPPSPLGQVGRRRSPLRSAMEEAYPVTSSWIGLNIEPNIPEHEELDISTLALSSVAENDDSQSSPLASFHNALPRSRRRPTSPLHQSASAPSLHARAVSPGLGSGRNSPNFLTHRYANEPYPVYSFGSASSMPSTPTSFRSRSPSISSLETIEDTPDAEEAARLEADDLIRLKADDGEGNVGDPRRRSSLDSRGSGLRSNKERKRWSVCGAERRADFSLEPIKE